MPEPGEEARAGRRARGKALDYDKLLEGLQQGTASGPKALVNSVGMAFVLIPTGTFQMGSPETEPGHRTNEGPVHEVLIGKPFYFGTVPVTQAQYLAITGRNLSRFISEHGGGPDHPVEMVSWDDAAEFCRLLSEQPAEGTARRSYRLPTEAEWEYACRAGTSTPFGHGETFASGQGNFDAGTVAIGRTTPVTRFPAGAWGLHDAHGNVWEWCNDWYSENYYRTTPLRDPPGPVEGKVKVLRGGSWRNQSNACRAAYRNALAPHQKDSATGFRVVLVVG